MTQFEEFITTLPDWDGKDRVRELEKLVKIETKIFYADRGYRQDYPLVWLRRIIIRTLQGSTDIFFVGEQGIGKSTLISYLFPYEHEMYPDLKTEARLIANCVSVHEVEFMPNLPVRYSGSLICYIRNIDYSYTDIDIKQLYAQVLAEQKKGIA